jgi:hypothetical protein
MMRYLFLLIARELKTWLVRVPAMVFRHGTVVLENDVHFLRACQVFS